VNSAIIPETVDALLGQAHRLLDDEERRSQGVQTRGAALLAFVGIVVPLAGLLAASTTTVAGSSRTALTISALLAFVSLLLAALLAVVKVLLPGARIVLVPDGQKRSLERLRL